MRLTRRGDYALRAVVYIASQPEGRIVDLMDIASKQSIPRSFLAKILQQLVRAGILRSYMGTNGGFCLAKSAQNITFYDVVVAVEGPMNINFCLGQDQSCTLEKGCLIHSFLESLQNTIKDKMQSKTLADMSARS